MTHYFDHSPTALELTTLWQSGFRGTVIWKEYVSPNDMIFSADLHSLLYTKIV